MRYSLRTLIEIVTVAAFVLALAYCWRSRPPSQMPAATPPPGRYQVFMSGESTMLLDTATGELWTRPKGYSQFHRESAPWKKP